MRTRAERRKNNFNHITKKKKISHNLMGTDWYEHDGQYSKGKIHCSCPMCTGKKNGRRRNNDHSPSDKKKLDRMKYNIHLMYENEDYSDIDTENYTTYVSEENIVSHDANI